MNGERRETGIRRILVALDASPHSLAALQAAADLAAGLDAELLGLFVEDINLLRLAGLPFAREFGQFSVSGRTIDVDGLERQLRARAGLAQQAVARVAGRARVRWSFRVTRGSVAAEVLAAAADADLMTLGRRGWSPAGRRLGSTARAVLAQAPSLALILEHGVRLGLPILAVYDGSPASERVLAVAVDLARLRSSKLSVLILAGRPEMTRDLRERAAAFVEDSGLEAQYRELSGPDTLRLVQVIYAEGCGLLIMGGENPFLTGDGLLGYLDEMRCPVLLVR